MNNPKITIIIPVYNLEDYISNCIESVINQDYKNLEIIVIDDGSTDGSWNKIIGYQQIDSRIVSLKQHNGGAAKARNTGLDYMTGDYVLFLDGDDMLSASVIADNIVYLENDLLLDWLAFSIKRVNKNGGDYRIDRRIYSDFLIENFEIVTKDQYVPFYYERKLSGVCCGAIYRVKSIIDLRFPVGEYYEDSFFFIDLLCKTTRGLKSPLGAYLYVDRDNSSQRAHLNYCRLKSSIHCSLYRFEQYRKIFPQYEQLYSRQESSIYYYIKNEWAKHLYDMDDIYDEYRRKMKSRLQVDWQKEIKIFIYRVFGYKNLVKISNLIRTACKIQIKKK